jgi:peptide/nickel transport system ATP-binding protein
MDLIIELCETDKMGLILITHDLSVVSQVTEKIAVMYAGRIVEKGPTNQVIQNPQHPYTQGLIAALPEGAKGSKRLNQIPGMMPTLANIPKGCAFHPRCPHVVDACKQNTPDLLHVKGMDTEAACILCKSEGEANGK